MKVPKCTACKQNHWPKDGCSLLATCLGCASKDQQIAEMSAKLDIFESTEFKKLYNQALQRREYQRKYMRDRYRENASG